MGEREKERERERERQREREDRSRSESETDDTRDVQTLHTSARRFLPSPAFCKRSHRGERDRNEGNACPEHHLHGPPPTACPAISGPRNRGLQAAQTTLLARPDPQWDRRMGRERIPHIRPPESVLGRYCPLLPARHCGCRGEAKGSLRCRHCHPVLLSHHAKSVQMLRDRDKQDQAISPDSWPLLDPAVAQGLFCGFGGEAVPSTPLLCPRLENFDQPKFARKPWQHGGESLRRGRGDGMMWHS
jgi:hypothetical protein